MSHLANKVVCRDFYREEVEDPDPIPISAKLPEVAMVTTHVRWYRQAKVKCGTCGFKGWTKPWKISGPNEECPTVSQVDDLLGEAVCPNTKCETRSEEVFLHNMVDPNDPEGRTIKEINLATTHKIPVGTLVETDIGVRLFVVRHTRDCDGTPLYSLGPDANDTEPRVHGFGNPGWVNGYGEESLTVVNNEAPRSRFKPVWRTLPGGRRVRKFVEVKKEGEA